PVTRLNSVVLPAPLGPMMARRSPGMMRKSTPRTACSPPKRFDRPLSSRTGVSVIIPPPRTAWGRAGAGRATARSLAELTRREVAAVDRLLEELGLAVLPELTDVRVGLDDRVPQLVLVVAEHLLLLDLLDVDVLHRVAHVVDAHRTARRVDLDGV